EPWHLPRASRQDAEALRARWRAIEEELKTTESEFAGIYEQGGEMRQTFVGFAPRAGFVYFYVYEHFAVIDFSHGSVEVTPSEIVFTVEREQQSESFNKQPHPTPRRWVAARWNRTNHLVPEPRISDFGDYVAGLGRYNDFNGPCCGFAPFLMSPARVAPERDYEHPAVPAKYERLMKRPIEATILWVGRKRRVKDYGSEGELYEHLHQQATLTPVRLDAGRRRGVRRGLLFRLAGVEGYEGTAQYLKITRVLPDSSQGVVVRDLDEEGRETFYDLDSKKSLPFAPVAVGMKVSTRPR
ncbi:MAG TPA: hypothetical protein VFX96_18270, partial [Pyrinomonadaceae bacterium]|nr:hypothetical protein [Pyrinomonadaceae bacterium]